MHDLGFAALMFTEGCARSLVAAGSSGNKQVIAQAHVPI
jgi:hypothetical protein